MSTFISTRLARRIAVASAILFVAAWAFVTLYLLFFICTNHFIDSVSIEDSSEWSNDFFSKSGFCTIRIRSHVASRCYVDDVSIVGKDRPEDWFEELGFEDIRSLEMGTSTFPSIFPDDRVVAQPAMAMDHPLAPGKFFYYYPKTGLLLCR